MMSKESLLESKLRSKREQLEEDTRERLKVLMDDLRSLRKDRQEVETKG